jgi:hypothetical protein
VLLGLHLSSHDKSTKMEENQEPPLYPPQLTETFRLWPVPFLYFYCLLIKGGEYAQASHNTIKA